MTQGGARPGGDEQMVLGGAQRPAAGQGLDQSRGFPLKDWRKAGFGGDSATSGKQVSQPQSHHDLLSGLP